MNTESIRKNTPHKKMEKRKDIIEANFVISRPFFSSAVLLSKLLETHLSFAHKRSATISLAEATSFVTVPPLVAPRFPSYRAILRLSD
jgi:hypothetical protein